MRSRDNSSAVHASGRGKRILNSHDIDLAMNPADDDQPELATSGDDGEAVLLAGLRAGDPEAFETLVRNDAGRMLATARRLLRSEQDAADAVQEAFLSAFQAIDKFEGQSTLGTWLPRIVINACLMKIRSASRRPEVSLDGLVPTFNRWGHHANSVRRWQSAADEALLSEET